MAAICSSIDMFCVMEVDVFAIVLTSIVISKSSSALFKWSPLPVSNSCAVL